MTSCSFCVWAQPAARVRCAPSAALAFSMRRPRSVSSLATANSCIPCSIERRSPSGTMGMKAFQAASVSCCVGMLLDVLRSSSAIDMTYSRGVGMARERLLVGGDSDEEDREAGVCRLNLRGE